MNEESANIVDLEDVALELLKQLKKVMPASKGRFIIDELDAEQAPGISIEMMEQYAIQYQPELRQEYKDVILDEFGYTF